MKTRTLQGITRSEFQRVNHNRLYYNYYLNGTASLSRPLENIFWQSLQGYRTEGDLSPVFQKSAR